MKLENKVSLVSACGRGIGKEVALTLAREGSDLIINSFSETNTESLVNELNKLGIKAIGVPGDITKSSVIVETVKLGIDTFGKIDILVNNVGGGAIAGTPEADPGNPPVKKKKPPILARGLMPGLRKRWSNGK